MAPRPRSGAPAKNRTTKNRTTPSKLLAAVGFRNLAYGALLLLVTVIAYMPALNGDLLWDDEGARELKHASGNGVVRRWGR
jgi:hypothetical protein